MVRTVFQVRDDSHGPFGSNDLRKKNTLILSNEADYKSDIITKQYPKITPQRLNLLVL